MYQQFLPVIFFLLALACMPFLIRWLKARVPSSVRVAGQQNRIVSAVAVGPHQKVVTVEVGPESARVWLTLGVGNNGITCLHTAEAPVTVHSYEGPSTIPGARA